MASLTQWQESERVPGHAEGQGSLVCCSPWGCKESDTTEPLNNKKLYSICPSVAGNVSKVHPCKRKMVNTCRVYDSNLMQEILQVRILHNQI